MAKWPDKRNANRKAAYVHVCTPPTGRRPCTFYIYTYVPLECSYLACLFDVLGCSVNTCRVLTNVFVCFPVCVCVCVGVCVD